ncbi:MAG: LPS export ABC transporter periplasmic protein LptC [Pseudomonadota bacterium]
MNSRTVVLIIVLLAAVIASRLLLDRPGSDADADRSRTARGPGYYMRDATVLGTGRDGRPLYSLQAGRIDEETDGSGARLSDIELEYRAEDAEPWHLRADTGHISPDGQTIQLAGNVVITELDDTVDEPTQVKAPDLTVDVETHFASTLQRVRILRGADFLDGTGMEAYLSDGRLLLQSDVQGSYQP